MTTTEIASGRAGAETVAVTSSNSTAIMLSMEFSDMTFEMHRLMTFSSWPQKNVFPQPSALVSAGFYYTGEADRTKCFSCEGEVFSWTPDMYPDAIHRTRFPHCLLVRGEETRHKPMQPSPEVIDKVEDFFKNKSVDLGFISRNTNIATQPSNPHGMTNPILMKSHVASRSSNSGLLSLTPPASLTPTVDYCDMRYEEARLRSFAHWPKSDMIRPSNLARAGLYFIGPGDRVQCAFCKGKLEGWMRGDNPLDEHKKHFSARCRFMQGAQVENVPIVQGDSPALSSPPVISSRRVDQVLRPRFPEYADVQRRLGSFSNWIPVAPTPRDMATAGFFYENAGDTVKCHSCGGTLNDWKPDDDPWLEHAHWFPHCTFLIQVKGPEFVETVIRNYSDLLSGGTGSRRTRNVAVARSRPVSTASSSGWSVDVIMASESAQTVLELGLLRVDVERAARIWASRNNGRIPDANSLAELAMNIAGGHDDSSSSGDSALTSSTPSVSDTTSFSSRNDITPQTTNGNLSTHKSKTSKKKKKNKNGSVLQELKKQSETSDPDDDDEEISIHERAKQVMGELDKLQEQWQCKVCMDETINMVFMPCGHMACCSMCAPALTKCPVCRSAIGDAVRIYLS